MANSNMDMGKISAQLVSEVKLIAEKIVKEVNAILAQEQKSHAEAYMDLAIQEFYSAYSPHLYGRTGGMKSFLHTEINNDDAFEIVIGSEFANDVNYRVSADYIFKVVFMAGYHGGAYKGRGYYILDKKRGRGRGSYWNPPHPDPGTPYWRTPYPFYSDWYATPAKRSEPPINIFTRMWNEYLSGEYQKRKEELEKQMIAKYNKEINDLALKYRPIYFEIRSQLNVK